MTDTDSQPRTDLEAWEGQASDYHSDTRAVEASLREHAKRTTFRVLEGLDAVLIHDGDCDRVSVGEGECVTPGGLRVGFSGLTCCHQTNAIMVIAACVTTTMLVVTKPPLAPCCAPLWMLADGKLVDVRLPAKAPATNNPRDRRRT